MAVIFYSIVRFARMAGSCGSAMKLIAIALFVATVSKFRLMKKPKSNNPMSSFDACLATGRRRTGRRVKNGSLITWVLFGLFI